VRASKPRDQAEDKSSERVSKCSVAREVSDSRIDGDERRLAERSEIFNDVLKVFPVRSEFTE
jgi:hypothetical protein